MVSTNLLSFSTYMHLAYGLMMVIFFIRLARIKWRQAKWENVRWIMTFGLALIVRCVVMVTLSAHEGLRDLADGAFLMIMAYALGHDRIEDKLSDLYMYQIRTFQIVHAAVMVSSIGLGLFIYRRVLHAYYSEYVLDHDYFLITGVLLGVVAVGLLMGIFEMRWDKPYWER